MTEPMRFDLVNLQPQFNHDLSTVRLQLAGKNGERVDADLPREELLPLIEALMRFDADLALRLAPGWDPTSGTPIEPQLGRPGPPGERVDFFGDVERIGSNDRGLVMIDFRATDGSRIRAIVGPESWHLLQTYLADPSLARPT